ncbi:MAG: hypothetical protein ACI4OI_05875 [Gemmiger sp.]
MDPFRYFRYLYLYPGCISEKEETVRGKIKVMQKVTQKVGSVNAGKEAGSGWQASRDGLHEGGLH